MYRLEEELAQLPKREQEKRERLEKKIEKALKEREPRKYLFDDNEFLDNREQMVEGVKNAVSDILKKRSHPSEEPESSSTSLVNKRQKVQSASTKKVVMSVFDDEDDESDDDESEQEEVSLPINSKGKAPALKSARTVKA